MVRGLRGLPCRGKHSQRFSNSGIHVFGVPGWSVAPKKFLQVSYELSYLIHYLLRTPLQ